MSTEWTPAHPAAIEMSVVLTDGYTGDWKSSLDVAKRLALQLDCYIKVKYVNRAWLIDKYTDIESLKNERVVVPV